MMSWGPRGPELVPTTLIPGTPMYGYGAPSWCELPGGARCVVGDQGHRVCVLDGNGEVSASLTTSNIAGWVTAIDLGDVGMILHDPVTRRRSVMRWRWREDRTETLWETTDLVGDLCAHADGSLAWLAWPTTSVPWEAARLWVLSGGNEPQRVDLPGTPAQPSWWQGSLLVSVEEGEWFRPGFVIDGRFTPWDVPEEEFRPDEYFGWKWSVALARGVFTVSVRDSSTTSGWWTPAHGWRRVVGGPDAITEVCGLSDRCVVLGSTVGGGTDVWEWREDTDTWRSLSNLVVQPRVGELHGILRSVRGVPFRWRTPAHPEMVPRKGARPGVMLRLHGGPASYAGLGDDDVDEMLARSGLAIASVDYRGSTSYGRTYRRSLFGVWGRADVDDARDVLEWACATGDIDLSRVFVRGSSAGALSAALVSIDPLVQGVVLIAPVTDPRALLEIDDEFEGGFLRQLVGDVEQMSSWSPVELVSRLGRRALVIQGDRDPVVPVEATRDFVARWRASGADVTYVELAGEGHSLRSPEARERALHAEMAFLGGSIRPF